jgi:hypothetical protein
VKHNTFFLFDFFINFIKNSNHNNNLQLKNNMTEKQETIQQENEQIDKSTDDIQLNETITNETQREL